MRALHQPGRVTDKTGTRRGGKPPLPRHVGLCGTLILLLACCGCPFSPQTPGGGDLPFLDGDENYVFRKATALPLASTDWLEFEGRIDIRSDLDLFELGPLSPGDRLLIDVQPGSSSLDLVAAVFDSREYLHAYNDDRQPDGSDLNPLLDFVIRGDADTYFLGITPYVDCGTTGTYRVTVRITRDEGVPSPEAQVVFLDWNGGQNIVIENVGTFDLTPFDAGDLGSYGDRTEEMKDRIQDIVEQRYAAYNLILMNSDDHAVPAVPHTTVYFGGQHSQAFAIAEQIDTMNENASDNAIVFTESYRSVFLRDDVRADGPGGGEHGSTRGGSSLRPGTHRRLRFADGFDLFE